MCHFFSSRCMLELKFAIYHRQASLSSQMYAVSAEESLKQWMTKLLALLSLYTLTIIISNSTILSNNFALLLNTFASMRTNEENSVADEAIVFSDWFEPPCENSKL